MLFFFYLFLCYNYWCGDIMKRVINYLNDLLYEGDTVVLGCSGGPDSMALLDVLFRMRKEKNISIICAHVNHKLRRESDDEMVWLEDVCKKHDIIFEKMIINNYGDDNFHNEARNIRYNFFEDMVRKYDAKYLMTAHHGDDLVETVLMRLVRGSTLNGYAGFSMFVDKGFYNIVRPLVFVTKEDILEYNKKYKLSYAVDKSNFSDKYTRNRYRRVVLPFLKEEDKNVHLKFLKYSNTLSLCSDYLEKNTSEVLKSLYREKYIDIDEFKKLDTVIQNEVINNLLLKFYQDDLLLISDVHTDLIKSLVYSNRANSYIYLPNSVKVIKSYDKVYFERETEQIDSYEIEILDYANLPNGKNIKVLESSEENNNFYCRLSSDDVAFPLHVRTRKSGDKMKVKGLNGSKKIKDIFIDSKVPLGQRDLWPVVVDSKDNIVWLPGLKKSKFDVPKNKNCDIILKYY